MAAGWHNSGVTACPTGTQPKCVKTMWHSMLSTVGVFDPCPDRYIPTLEQAYLIADDVVTPL